MRVLKVYANNTCIKNKIKEAYRLEEEDFQSNESCKDVYISLIKDEIDCHCYDIDIDYDICDDLKISNGKLDYYADAFGETVSSLSAEIHDSILNKIIGVALNDYVNNGYSEVSIGDFKIVLCKNNEQIDVPDSVNDDYLWYLHRFTITFFSRY